MTQAELAMIKHTYASVQVLLANANAKAKAINGNAMLSMAMLPMPMMRACVTGGPCCGA
jgi:hypothetical protein